MHNDHNQFTQNNFDFNPMDPMNMNMNMNFNNPMMPMNFDPNNPMTMMNPMMNPMMMNPMGSGGNP